MDLTAIGFALCTTFNLHPCNIDTVIAAWQSEPGKFVRMCDSRWAVCPMVPSYLRTECLPDPLAKQIFVDGDRVITRKWFQCWHD